MTNTPDPPKSDKKPQHVYYDGQLFDADPTCNHDIRPLWSGVRCSKCKGWFCY